jgi:exoribonuclease-2
MSKDKEAIGAVALVREGNSVDGGTVVEWSKKGIVVETADGRRLKTTAAALLALDESPAARRAPGAFVEAVQARAVAIDLRTAWELLQEEEGGNLSLDDIVALTGNEEDPVERVAVLVSLQLGDGLFKRKGESWVPLSAKAVAEREAQAERVREKEAQQARRVAELRRLESGELAVDGLSDEGRASLLAIQQCAIDGEETPAATRLLAELFPEEKRAAHVVGFEWLVRIGIFDEHEDLNLRRLDASPLFPGEVLEEAERLRQNLPSTLVGRKRLDGLRFVAIDDEETDEVDDAIAVEATPDGGCRIHVVVCDVAAGVPRGGAVDEEAARRATTIYHPVQRIPMLPEVLSCDALSLAVGQERLVLDHVFAVDSRGSVYDFQVRPAVVSLADRLTYDEADAQLGTGEGTYADDLQTLWRVAERLFNERVGQGAIHFFPIEAKIRVVDGEVTVKRIDNFAPSRRLVSEYMVACGGAVGRMLAEQCVPAIYRRQVAPSEPIEWDEESARDPVYMLDNVRKLKRAEISLQADRHHALGLMAYSQVTSPLRRYGDLLMQRQLHSFLVRGVPEYGDGELLKRMTVAEQTALQVRRAVGEAERYWALVALAARADVPLEAVVLDDDPRRMTVLLPDYGIQTRLHARRTVHAGERLQVRVARSIPRTDTLVLSEV